MLTKHVFLHRQSAKCSAHQNNENPSPSFGLTSFAQRQGLRGLGSLALNTNMFSLNHLTPSLDGFLLETASWVGQQSHEP